jgi:hypothetical protein
LNTRYLAIWDRFSEVLLRPCNKGAFRLCQAYGCMPPPFFLKKKQYGEWVPTNNSSLTQKKSPPLVGRPPKPWIKKIQSDLHKSLQELRSDHLKMLFDEKNKETIIFWGRTTKLWSDWGLFAEQGRESKIIILFVKCCFSFECIEIMSLLKPPCIKKG